jgi:hypothetical protein
MRGNWKGWQRSEPVKKTLTDRQRQVYEFIQARIVGRGHAPTIREIGLEFGISSTNGVRTHLTALIKKGYLKKQEFISRGIELVRSLASETARVPLVGSVSMDMLAIDLTESNAGEGDDVVLLGSEDDQTIDAFELARHAGVPVYEILCGFGLRLPKVFLEQGRVVAVASKH